MDILILLADLALTVFVYCSPAAVYRFLIKKEPAEKKLARNFCIISSVIVYLLLLVIYLSAGFDIVPNVTAAAIWGFVSYRILLYEDKSKAKTEANPADDSEPVPTQLSIFDAPEIQPTSNETLEENLGNSEVSPFIESCEEPATFVGSNPDSSLQQIESRTEQENPQQIGNGPIIIACSVILLVLILSIVFCAIEYC